MYLQFSVAGHLHFHAFVNNRGLYVYWFNVNLFPTEIIISTHRSILVNLYSRKILLDIPDVLFLLPYVIDVSVFHVRISQT